MSRIFHPCNMVPHFHVPQFHVSHFQRPRCNVQLDVKGRPHIRCALLRCADKIAYFVFLLARYSIGKLQPISDRRKSIFIKSFVVLSCIFMYVFSWGQQ